MSVCCAVNLVNYISALQRAGEADVKRDLDYSRFSEITRCQLLHNVIVHQNRCVEYYRNQRAYSS